MPKNILINMPLPRRIIPQITPIESYADLAKEIGVESLYFKREDLHPLGSHKGRSIPHMIDIGLSKGVRHFVISSSGNAALAAALYVKSLNEKSSTSGDSADNVITLEIFAGKKINEKKLAKLQALKNEHILVSVQDRPLQALFMKIKDPSIRSLRQSTDPVALDGYESLARELAEIPDLAAVFIGTSSGTTAQALAHYFLHNGHGKNGHDKKNTGSGGAGGSGDSSVEIHIVQTPSCHPMVKALGKDQELTNETSIADAIVDRTAERASILIPLIEKTGGAGWIADNESIGVARDIVKKHARGLVISTNSALSVAGLMNAVYTGRTWHGSVVCMICGE
jgi:hypothetical protein